MNSILNGNALKRVNNVIVDYYNGRYNLQPFIIATYYVLEVQNHL